MTLTDVKVGSSAIVKCISGNSLIKSRLEEMGIVKGIEISVQRYAPLGDPIEIIVRGYSLAIRKSEGRMIEVK